MKDEEKSISNEIKDKAEMLTLENTTKKDLVYKNIKKNTEEDKTTSEEDIENIYENMTETDKQDYEAISKFLSNDLSKYNHFTSKKRMEESFNNFKTIVHKKKIKEKKEMLKRYKSTYYRYAHRVQKLEIPYISLVEAMSRKFIGFNPTIYNKNDSNREFLQFQLILGDDELIWAGDIGYLNGNLLKKDSEYYKSCCKIVEICKIKKNRIKYMKNTE